jgi:hypothetical protein
MVLFTRAFWSHCLWFIWWCLLLLDWAILFFNILFGASLLLHFIVSHNIYLYHYMSGFDSTIMTSLFFATEWRPWNICINGNRYTFPLHYLPTSYSSYFIHDKRFPLLLSYLDIHLLYYGNKYFLQQSYKSIVSLSMVIGLPGHGNRKLEKFR